MSVLSFFTVEPCISCEAPTSRIWLHWIGARSFWYKACSKECAWEYAEGLK